MGRPLTIKALRRSHNAADKPDWSLMQQLSDAGIGVSPCSGMPVFDPSACAPALRTAIWRAYCGVAKSVDSKALGQMDEVLEELQMRLHEHAAQITENAPRSKRLGQGGAGPSAKRPRSSSLAASSSDEGTDTGRPGKRQRRPMSDEDASTTSVPQFAGSEEGGGGGSLTEGGQQPLPSAPQPPPRETVVSRDHGRS